MSGEALRRNPAATVLPRRRPFRATPVPVVGAWLPRAVRSTQPPRTRPARISGRTVIWRQSACLRSCERGAHQVVGRAPLQAEQTRARLTKPCRGAGDRFEPPATTYADFCFGDLRVVSSDLRRPGRRDARLVVHRHSADSAHRRGHPPIGETRVPTWLPWTTVGCPVSSKGAVWRALATLGFTR